MKKITLKIPAKINLTLDILGASGGFHDLESLVASINVYDQITVRERADRTITLKNQGIPLDCDIFTNNAYKAGQLFMDTFNTKGVDIHIKKSIPVGSGLGGSSADTAGVLKAMKLLYDVNGKITPLANELGSDTAYMLNGGYAVISGRGEKVSKKHFKKELYLLLITEQEPISSRACYKAYDDLGKMYEPCTKNAEEALKKGDFAKFCTVIKNDLESGAGLILDQIKGNIVALRRSGASTALMTGSGSCVYGIYENKRARDGAFRKLKGLYKGSLIKAHTLITK